MGWGELCGISEANSKRKPPRTCKAYHVVFWGPQEGVTFTRSKKKATEQQHEYCVFQFGGK